MLKILIASPLAANTFKKIGLKSANFLLFQQAEIACFQEEIFYGQKDREEIFYVPSIYASQIPEEKQDPSLESLDNLLTLFQPDVLIVGSNAVPGKVLDNWRKAVGINRKLLLIRRGVDTRAIDKVAAQKNNVFVDNLPGINSPYVAQHMIKYLQLEQAKAGEKMAVIGVGNIGKDVAIKAIEEGFQVRLFSPSLQDKHQQSSILQSRGIPAEKVVCCPSISTAMEGANYVSIAVPWERDKISFNAGIITEENIKQLSNNARIVSASVPKVFTDDALILMNKLMKSGNLYVRIDTSKRRAIEAKENYAALDIAYEEAFSAPECQQALDQAMLEKARNFFSIYS